MTAEPIHTDDCTDPEGECQHCTVCGRGTRYGSRHVQCAPGYVPRPGTAEAPRDTCRHGWPEGDCPACAACAACLGDCGVCRYSAAETPPTPEAAPVTAETPRGDDREAMAQVLRGTGFWATHADRWNDAKWQEQLWSTLADAVLAAGFRRVQ